MTTARGRLARRAILFAAALLTGGCAAAQNFCSNCVYLNSGAQVGILSVTSGTFAGLVTAGAITTPLFSATSITAGTFTGDASHLTVLNASAISSGTVPTPNLAGNYQGVTGVGHISSGTWQGAAVGTQYGGTGQNLVNVSTGAIPYFSNTGTMGVVNSPAFYGVLVEPSQFMAPVWVSSPALQGYNFVDLPVSALIGSTLPTSITVSTNSIPLVNGTAVLGNIAGDAAGLTGILPQSQVATGTWSSAYPASSVTVTGTNTGICGGPGQLCAPNIHSDGRIYGWTQYTNVVYSTEIASGPLPPDVTMSFTQITTGTTSAWVGTTSSVTASAFFGDGSHLQNVSAAFLGGGVPNQTTFASSVTVNGAGGILSASSVTASAFFGDGSHLLNVPPNFHGGTVSGQVTVQSSITVQGVGGLLATSSVTAGAFFGDGSHLVGLTDFGPSTAALQGAVNTLGASTSSLNASVLGLQAQFVTNASSETNISVGGLLVRSSVTAGSFFGDGSHLSGVVSTLGNLTGPVTSVGAATTIVGPVPQSAVNLSTVTIQLNILASTFVNNPSSSTNSSAGGLLVASSVTAGAFYGDGSHLVGVGSNPTWSTITGFPSGCGLPFVVGSVGTALGCVQPSNVTGNAATATAFTAAPTGCALPLVSTGIAANGNALCGQPSNITGNAPTSTLATAVASGGVNFSTITATFNNYLPLSGGAMSGNLTLTSPAVIAAVSSITAGSFFGDGSHLTNVDASGFTGGVVPNWTLFQSSVNFSSNVVIAGNLQIGTVTITVQNSGNGILYELSSATFIVDGASASIETTGFISAASSVTASAFVGDGRYLTNVVKTPSYTFQIATANGDYATLAAAVAGVEALGLPALTTVTFVIAAGEYTETPVVLPGNYNLVGPVRGQSVLNYNSSLPAITLTGSNGLVNIKQINAGGPGIDITSSSSPLVMQNVTITAANTFGVRISSAGGVQFQNNNVTATFGPALWITGNAGPNDYGSIYTTNGSGNALLITGTGNSGGAYFDTTFNGTTGNAAVMLDGTTGPRFQNIAVCAKAGQYTFDSSSQMTGNADIALGVAQYTNSCTGGGSGFTSNVGPNVQIFSNVGVAGVLFTSTGPVAGSPLVATSSAAAAWNSNVLIGANGSITAMSTVTVYGIIASSTTQGSISCTAGSPTLNSTCTDQHCTFTAGTAATACTYTFGRVLTQTPDCVATTNAATPIALSITSASNSSITISAGVTALTGDTITFLCMQAP